MSRSDMFSSVAVLPEENSRAGMGYASISQLLSMMKWNNDDLIIIYDPDTAFRDMFPDALIVSPSCEYAGEQK